MVGAIVTKVTERTVPIVKTAYEEKGKYLPLNKILDYGKNFKLFKRFCKAFIRFVKKEHKTRESKFTAQLNSRLNVPVSTKYTLQGKIF